MSDISAINRPNFRNAPPTDTAQFSIDAYIRWLNKGEQYQLQKPVNGRMMDIQKVWERQDKHQTGGGRRGNVREYSKRSVKTMRRRLFGINRDQAEKLGYKCFFVTLTYPKVWPKSGDKIKRDLDVFIKRWRRRYGRSFCVWKLEEQKRGAPHYHLLIFTKDADGHDRQRLNEWIAEDWPEIIFQDKSQWEWTDGLRTKQPTRKDKKKAKSVTSRKESVEYVADLHDDRIMDYVMKYSAKRGKHFTCVQCGKSWGENKHDRCPDCESPDIKDNRAEWGERWGIRGRERYEALVEWATVKLNRDQYEALCILASDWLQEKRGCGAWLQSEQVKSKVVFMELETIKQMLNDVGVMMDDQQPQLLGRFCSWQDVKLENWQKHTERRQGREPPPERKNREDRGNGPLGNSEKQNAKLCGS